MKAAFGILLYLTTFWSVGALQGCAKTNVKNTTSTMDTANTPKTFLALGDSYTIGQSVGEEERFPFLTARILREQGLDISMPKYIATTGWTTANLLTAVNKEPAAIFDIVTLLIGVNDQYQGVDTAVYRTRFLQLLEKALLFSGNRPSRVFVLSIPDYAATPFVNERDKERVSAEIAQFNAINKQETGQKGVTYIDITPLTKEAATDGTLLASDGLHYSGKEHQKWAQLLAPKIKAVLR